MDSRTLSAQHALVGCVVMLLAMREARFRQDQALPALLWAWLPVVAWAALIFAFSAQPDLRVVPNDASLDFVVRKLGHLGVFGILALLLWRALANTAATRRPWAWAFGLTVLYAVTDEVHQGFVPGRYTSLADIGIDAAGALSFLLLVRSLRSWRR